MISANLISIMSKTIAEQSLPLNIFWLKKQGYLNKNYSYCSFLVSWTSSRSGNKSNINLSIDRDSRNSPEEAYIKLNYIYTDYWTKEKSKMDFKVSLTTTQCNYGGVRYWFICPLTKNGQYCGRRVGVLYAIGKWFGCRHCGKIAYQSQMYGGRNKGFVSIPDIERAEEKVKRYYYKGKPTRKYRKVIKLNKKFESGFLGALVSLLHKNGKLGDLLK